MAHNYGLLQANNGLVWGKVAYNFQLLGCPGSPKRQPEDSQHRLYEVYMVGLWFTRCHLDKLSEVSKEPNPSSPVTCRVADSGSLYIAFT